jgi:hypothetical protein
VIKTQEKVSCEGGGSKDGGRDLRGGDWKEGREVEGREGGGEEWSREAEGGGLMDRPGRDRLSEQANMTGVSRE